MIATQTCCQDSGITTMMGEILQTMWRCWNPTKRSYLGCQDQVELYLWHVGKSKWVAWYCRCHCSCRQGPEKLGTYWSWMGGNRQAYKVSQGMKYLLLLNWWFWVEKFISMILDIFKSNQISQQKSISNSCCIYSNLQLAHEQNRRLPSRIRLWWHEDCCPSGNGEAQDLLSEDRCCGLHSGNHHWP